MRKFKAGEWIDDEWQMLPDDAHLPAEGRIIVNFRRLFGEDAEHLYHKDCCLGVTLDPADDAGKLEPWIERLSVIRLHFPVFSDGRQLSQARILRDRFGFAGELRASGDLLPDLYQFMLQVGFNAFEVPEERHSNWSTEVLRMPLAYQSGYREDFRPTLSVLEARHRGNKAVAA